MEKNNQARAEEYYKLLGEKNVEGIKRYLHPDVEFCSPVTTLKGKEVVIDWTHAFMGRFTSLKIRSKFGSADQGMVVYDLDIPGIAKNFPAAALLSFQSGLIIKIELFFDKSRFL